MKCELRNDVYLIGGANPANPACELLKVRIADLEDKADNETNAAWLSGLQGSGFDSTIEATVLGSVAGGVQKAFKIPHTPPDTTRRNLGLQKSAYGAD